MFTNEVFSHLLVTFVYFVMVSVLRWKADLGLIGLWLGALVGTFFLDIDHLLYWFFTQPEQEDSKEAKRIWDSRELKITERLKQLYKLLQKVHDLHIRLIFHSTIGQVVLLILAIYLLTSGGSIFGSAFIVAINLHLLKDEWFDYFKDKNHLCNWLFWQIGDPKVRGYLRGYLIAVTLIFLFLTRLLA